MWTAAALMMGCLMLADPSGCGSEGGGCDTVGNTGVVFNGCVVAGDAGVLR